jgi:polysaccharide biosynthesis/export protein
MRGLFSLRGNDHRITSLPSFVRLTFLALASLGLLLVSSHAQSTAGQADVQKLREGDVIRVVFPGASNLDTTQQIRRDGRVNLFIIGELEVAGLTPAELEQELVRRYAGQLTSNEVNVSLVSSTFSVLVTGAVLRPGKIESGRPLTILEAIMEAGGFEPGNAKTKAVVVMRTEGSKIRRITLDLQKVLDGRDDDAFYLQPSDMIYVPRRFSMF